MIEDETPLDTDYEERDMFNDDLDEMGKLTEQLVPSRKVLEDIISSREDLLKDIRATLSYDGGREPIRGPFVHAD